MGVTGRGSGLLVDELNWPIRERIAPTLCFGVAVDGGGCVYENLFSHFRSIAKKYQFRQAVTALKHSVPDNFNSRRNGNATQASAMEEGIIPDTGDTVRDCDVRKVAAPMEGFVPNGGRTVTNRDASQVPAFIERGITDGADAIKDVVIGSFFPFRVGNQ